MTIYGLKDGDTYSRSSNEEILDGTFYTSYERAHEVYQTKYKNAHLVIVTYELDQEPLTS